MGPTQGSSDSVKSFAAANIYILEPGFYRYYASTVKPFQFALVKPVVYLKD